MKYMGFVGLGCLLFGPLLALPTYYSWGYALEDPWFVAILFHLALGFLSVAVFSIILFVVGYRSPIWAKLSLPVVLFLGYCLLTYFMFPVFGWAWWQGAGSRLESEIGLEDLQSWGQGVLARYERKELHFDGKCNYIGGHAPRIAASEIPDFIQRATWGGWGNPEVGMPEPAFTNGRYVEFAWHGQQLMVGKPNLEFVSKPKTLTRVQLLRPGVLMATWDVR